MLSPLAVNPLKTRIREQPRDKDCVLLCNWLLVSFNHSQLLFVRTQMTKRELSQIMAVNLASVATHLSRVSSCSDQFPFEHKQAFLLTNDLRLSVFFSVLWLQSSLVELEVCLKDSSVVGWRKRTSQLLIVQVLGGLEHRWHAGALKILIPAYVCVRACMHALSCMPGMLIILFQGSC